MCSQHPSDTGFGGFKRWAVEVDVRVFFRHPGHPLVSGRPGGQMPRTAKAIAKAARRRRMGVMAKRAKLAGGR